ncbi:FCD domain-containing protein [Terasakiella sp. SH-1]|uniref:FCD domain-containing protein n=1 Tax=Terasakiella sp. SH-1 TaxID=2560057 RepID=UPI0010742AB4|nr:FCD domain-containing protein [Terasakiella sp. SH-1]
MEITGRKTDFVIAELEQKILDGTFAQGEMLPSERDLMDRFGVGRNIIREAISSLSRNGLLITKPRHRPVVAQAGYDTALESLSALVHHFMNEDGGFKNLYDSRIFIETSLSRYAALNARKDDIARLKEALENNRAAMENPEEFYRTDVLFHKVLYEIPKNPIYTALQNAYVSWLSGHWPKMERGVEINKVTFAGHEAVYNAILERDPDGAEEAMHNHLKVAWEHIRSTF